VSDQSDAEGPREEAPNPTQEAIDEEGASDQPVDVGGWTEEPGDEASDVVGWEETESSPHQGEAGQSDDVA
jgi:hypothetical protein